MIADFVDPPNGLGDGYRVDARIVIWEGSRVLKVPASALFRAGSSWSTFVLENGRARLRQVDAGQRNALEVEITKGLEEGTEVILHPSNDLKYGARVAFRPRAVNDLPGLTLA